MNRDTLAFAVFALCAIAGTIHLTRKVRREWSDMTKRGVNIVFIIAIACGLFVAGISIYRVAIDMGIAR